MVSYLIRRFLHGVFVLLFIIWFVFTLSYFQPDGALAPAYLLCKTHTTRACLNHYINLYGLAKPYPIRLWQYVEGVVVHFNLGFSFDQTQSVSSLLTLYIPRTFWIAFISLVLALLIALPVGLVQAWRRNSIFDYVATGTGFFFYSVPPFVLGFVLLDIFAYHNNWLPAEPPSTTNPWQIFLSPAGFILPVATLTALSVAGLSRFMRSQVLDVLVQDYIRTARAKGCSAKRVLFRHTMRNALGPVVVIIGLFIPGLLSGALIVEVVFAYPGLGFETVFSAQMDDIYVLLGITVLITALTVLGNLLADIALVVINPRIRIEGRAR